jgi:O-antigen ligase
MRNTDNILDNQRAKFYLFLAFLSGLAIPISTSLQNITIFLMISIALLEPKIRYELKSVIKNYFIILSILFYVVILLWSFISYAPIKDIMRMLIKLRLFILIPFIFAFFSVLNFRIASLYGFIIGVVISILLSYVAFIFHIQIFNITLTDSFGDWAVFRYHTYHNYFIGVAIIGLLSLILYYGDKFSNKIKIFIFIVISIFAINILYIVVGRTGQILLILMSLIVLFFYNKKMLLLYLAGTFCIIFIVYFTSPAVKVELRGLNSDMKLYDKGDTRTSVGNRIDYIKFSYQLVKKHPIIGYGTGSYQYEYAKLNPFNSKYAPLHPHNDFYLFWVENGIIGLIIFVMMLLSILYYSYKLRTPEGIIALSIVVSYIVGAFQGGFFQDNITNAALIVMLAVLLSGNTLKFIKK